MYSSKATNPFLFQRFCCLYACPCLFVCCVYPKTGEVLQRSAPVVLLLSLGWCCRIGSFLVCCPRRLTPSPISSNKFQYVLCFFCGALLFRIAGFLVSTGFPNISAPFFATIRVNPCTSSIPGLFVPGFLTSSDSLMCLYYSLYLVLFWI